MSESLMQRNISSNKRVILLKTSKLNWCMSRKRKNRTNVQARLDHPQLKLALWLLNLVNCNRNRRCNSKEKIKEIVKMLLVIKKTK
jgi:hypothetical protein